MYVSLVYSYPSNVSWHHRYSGAHGASAPANIAFFHHIMK